MIHINENNITYKLGRNAKENFQIIDDAQKTNPEYLEKKLNEWVNE